MSGGAVAVLVTGVSGGSIGEQVCKALRRGARRYELTAANLEPSKARVVQADHFEALPAAGDPTYVDAVLEIAGRRGCTLVAPGSEPELFRLARERERLRAEGVTLLANDLSVIDLCADKRRTAEALAAGGFRVPTTCEVGAEPDLRRLPSDGFPMVVKPARGSGGSNGVFLAQDPDELRFFATWLLRSGQGAVVQEYVGDATSEYTVGVLSYPDGELAGSVALRRDLSGGLSTRLRAANRTARLELGPVLAVSSGVSQGRIADFPAIRSEAEAMARALGSRGPLNLQGREEGGRFIVFEINPRFSGTTPMRAMAGFNEPELLIDWHLAGGVGRPAPSARPGEFTRGLLECFQPDA